MSSQHTSLAAGRWQQFTLAEQLGHVGSEVSRIRKAQGDEQRFWSAATRAFELLDLTIEDPRWRLRLRQLLRVREFLELRLQGVDGLDARLQALQLALLLGADELGEEFLYHPKPSF